MKFLSRAGRNLVYCFAHRCNKPGPISYHRVSDLNRLGEDIVQDVLHIAVLRTSPSRKRGALTASAIRRTICSLWLGLQASSFQ
jgi:hypothetical protein